MRRREVIAALWGGVLVAALPVKSAAQNTKRIGILVANGTPEWGRWRVEAFDRGLRGDDGDLRFLPGGREACVEGFERRIISTGSHGRHVEHPPDRCAATPDAAHAFEFATVEVVGRDPNDCGDLPTAHLAEFRQQCDEREREGPAKIGEFYDGSDTLVALLPP